MIERVRNSIAIQGINSAQPCHTVGDGAMADIFNLRYKNGAFENVYEPKLIHPISDSGGFVLLHFMEVLPGARYIARQGGELHQVEVVNGVVSSVQKIGDVGVANLRIDHFGSVLYANYTISGERIEQSWVYKNEVFTSFSISELQPPTFNVTYDRELAPKNGERPFLDYLFDGNLILKRSMKDSGAAAFTLGDEYEYGIAVAALQDRGYVVGDFVIMLAYKLFDGSIVNPGKPIYISSYKHEDTGHDIDDNSLIRLFYRGGSNDTYEEYFYDKIRGVKPTITLTSEDLSNDDIVKSVVVLSTRAQIIYDYDNIYKKFATGGTCPHPEFDRPGQRCSVDYRARIIDDEIKFMEQPFYEIAEFEIGEATIELEYEKHYRHITNQDIYKASYSLHHVLSKGKYEYNNRLHSFGISLKPFSGYNLATNEVDNYLGSYTKLLDLTVNYDVKLAIGSRDYNIRKSVVSKVAFYDAYESGVYRSAGLVISTPVIYPDTRAKSIAVWVIYNDRKYQANIRLKDGAANNLAYYTMPSTNRNFIDSFAKLTLEGSDFAFITKPDTVVDQFNKLYVSAQNNPFVVMPSNIYSVGESECVVDSIDTATEQVTETKFGVFPLNAFTNKGIYALEVGSGEVLYQRIVGLSNISKLPGTTTVGALNVLFFISERGVMAINGRSVDCISEHLDRYPSLHMGLDDFKLYKIGAQLSYNPIEMELMLGNSRYNYTYIYSLNGKFWSRRSWVGKQISGSSDRIMIPENGIASSWNEDKELPVRLCSLESRALKLGSLEYKRIDTLVARLTKGANSCYEIWLYGSNDLSNWIAIGKCDGTPMIRRTGASFSYFRVRINCTVRDYFMITNFDVEFYNRFVRRLR